MADDPSKQDPPDPKSDPPADLGDAGKKALDAERKARRDAEQKLKALEDQLKELQDKDKSEVERLRDEVESLKAQAQTSSAAALRAEVAMAKGLTPAQAKRLVGDTREDLEADADEILEAFPVQGGATPPPSNKPATDLRGGTEPNDDPVETDPAKLAASVPRVN